MSTWSPSLFVLVVEDNVADAYLIQRAIRTNGLDLPLFVVDDGEEAIHWIEDTARTSNPTPQAVVLDLNLPKCSGLEVLKRLRATPRFRDIPVIVFSSYITEEDRRFESPDTQFLRKPCDLESFARLGSMLRELLNEKSVASSSSRM
jgi:CheY-like chemotaxis protein